MKKKLIHSWVQTEEFRNSMPNIICNNFYYLYDDNNSNSNTNNQPPTLTEIINKKLLNYKELRYIYKKTSIPPIFFLYCLLIGLLLFMIGFFDDLFATLIGTIYPLYNSMKAIQYKYIGEFHQDGRTYYTIEQNAEEIRVWLTYWVVYSMFINFECLFRCLLTYIPFYFFFKVLFLLVCYLPNYQLAKWLYNNMIKWWFRKYERNIVKISDKLITTLKLKNDTIDSNTNGKEFVILKQSCSKWKQINENTRYESVESDTVYDNPFTPWTKDSFSFESYDNENNKTAFS